MKKIKEKLSLLLLLLPACTIFAIFIFWPILNTFYLSFFDWNMISKNKKFVFPNDLYITLSFYYERWSDI